MVCETGHGKWAATTRTIGAADGRGQPGWSDIPSLDLSWHISACVSADVTAQVCLQRHDTDCPDDTLAYDRTLCFPLQVTAHG